MRFPTADPVAPSDVSVGSVGSVASDSFVDGVATLCSFIVVAVALDVLRWCGCCTAVVDALLGFRSARLEQLRLLPQTLMLIPFAHLSFLLSRPIEMECCIGSPKPPMVYDRVRVLAWLSIIVSYCLFSDAHNHGFFLLRSVDRSAAALLRPRLGPEHQRHAADAAVLALAARLDST